MLSIKFLRVSFWHMSISAWAVIAVVPHTGHVELNDIKELGEQSLPPNFGQRIGKVKLRILIPAKRNIGRRKSNESHRHC